MEFFPETYVFSNGLSQSDDRSTFLADWSTSNWDKLLEHIQTQMFAPGDMVIRAGAIDRALYIVTFGKLATFVNSKKRIPFRVGRAKNSSLVAVVESGSVMNALGFFDGAPSMATYQARTECQLLYLSFDSFTVFAARHPELGQEILLDLGRLLADQVRRMSALLASSRGNQ